MPLPHFVPNLGVRLTAGGTALAYTGDHAPDPGVVELARDADLLLAEASFADAVPEAQAGGLSCAADAGEPPPRRGRGGWSWPTSSRPPTRPRLGRRPRPPTPARSTWPYPGLTVDL